MKQFTFYSLFILLFIQLPHSKAQLGSRLVRTEDSLNYSFYDYTNTIYSYSKNRGHYKTHPVLNTYLEFDSSITASYAFSWSTLDSFITVYEYDGHNNVIRDYYPTKYGNQWSTAVAADSSVYDLKGNLYRSYGGYRVHGIFEATSNTFFDYNHKGQMISRIYASYNHPQDSQMISYSYDLLNNMSAKTTYGYSKGVWVNAYRTNYQYARQHLVQQTEEKWNGTAWDYQQRSDYIYDANKSLNKILHYNWSAGWQLQGTDSNVYDANSNLSLHFYTYATGDILKDSNTFDADHNRLSMLQTYYNPLIGIHQNKQLITTTYNKYNQVLINRKYDWNGISVRWENSDSDPYYKRNYYEEYPITGIDPLPYAAHALLQLYPIPAGNLLHIKTTLQNEQTCLFRITDITGKLLRQWTEKINGTGESTVPVNELLPGNYILQLITNEDSHTRPFIINR